MSNQLAVATVTGALNFRLSQLVASEMPAASVTNLRPNAPSGLPATGVNVFLYQVTPNPAGRNTDLPTRRADGSLLKRPAVALDLHYMLSFYGDDLSWEPQLLLGSVVRSLHEQPVIDAATISAMLADTLYEPLRLTNLMDALEPVRLSPTALTFEDLAKLWGIFYQIPYVLSVAYVARAVFIEAESAPSAALPVRSFQLGAVPLQPPVLLSASSASAPSGPLAPSDALLLKGRDLLGGVRQSVLIDGAPATVSNATAEQYTVALPPGITAGVHGVQLLKSVQVTSTYTSVVQSNLLTFAVRPEITAVSATTSSTPTGPAVEIVADVTPAVGPTQRVQLALSTVGAKAPSYFLEARVGATPNSVVAAVSSHDATQPVLPGTYVLRVFVGGIPSPLGPASGPYSTPSVVVS